MFKFKKIIASVLTSIMTFSMAMTVSLAAVPSDVANTKFEEAAEVLGVLNVMVGDDNGAFRPDDTIIRSEVAKVAVALSGLTDVANVTSGKTKYPDVPQNHWANGFINVATDQKLVIGDTEGTFRPNADITFQEAVTILVRALGYEVKAQAKGGYPTGYLVTASDIGLTKGISGSQSSAISRGDVARLAYNALTINLMEQTGFGADVNWEVVEKTLLEDKLDVEKITAQVMAVGNASLKGTSSLDKDEILIGDEIFEVGSADVRQILGFNVDAYVKESNSSSKRVLLLARPSENMNNSISVMAEDIAEITNTESLKELKYWKNPEKDSKTTKVTIENDANILYNGKSASAEDFKKISSGSITLLDTDTSGTYDVVFVNETINYVVEEVVVSSNKIVDKYGQKTLVADPEDDSLIFVIVKGSDRIEIKDLKEWDVLTVTKSKDGQLVYAEVSTEKVEGKVTEIGDDLYFINGKGYEKASNYTSEIKLNDEGTFYLDIDGKIAAVSGETTVSSNYAYLTDAGMTTGMDKTLEIKIFTKDGKTMLLKTDSKVKLNGVAGKTPEQVLDTLNGSDEKVDPRLITFEKNSDGVVTQINTATNSSAINEDKFMMNMVENDVVYKKASGKLVGTSMSVNITEDTIVFDIPEGKTDTSDFAVRGHEFFTDGDKYNVKVFDVTEERNAKAVIVTNSTGTADEEAALAIVDKITSGKNNNDDEIQILYAYQNGEKIQIPTAEAGILVKGEGKPLAQGDIIQFETNIKGEIESIKVVFDIETKETEAENTISEKMSTYYGKVVKKFSNSFNMQVGSGAIKNFAIGNAKIYTVDTSLSRNQITVGDAGDIQKYDDLNPERIFVRVYEDVVKEIVIIK